MATTASWLQKITLRRFNNALSIVIALLAAYILLAPVWPEVSWWWHHLWYHDNPAIVRVTKTAPRTPISKDNRLIIPRIEMDSPVNSENGNSAQELDKELPWLVPGTSTPDKGSNTVLAGHRFAYTSPRGIFYYLNKIQLDDRVTVDWKGKEYTYKVATMREVAPTQVSIQDHSSNSMVTLFTCTPLWSPHDRLVVQANLVGVRQ